VERGLVLVYLRVGAETCREKTLSLGGELGGCDCFCWLNAVAPQARGYIPNTGICLDCVAAVSQVQLA
jgi:hypothetical protein